MNSGRTEGNKRTVRVAGVVALAALVAGMLASVPAADATREGGSAHAGHGHGRVVPLHRLEAVTRNRWPKSFAGLWHARGKVFVAFTRRAKLRAKRVRRATARPGRLRSVSFDFSLRQLESTQETMVAERTSRPPGLIDVPDYDLDIDVTKNAPVVTFEEVAPEFVAVMKARYGEHVIVREGPLGDLDACVSRFSCTPYLRSGLRTVGPENDPDGGLFQCSTAFAVQQRSAAYRGILSAGHCGGIGVDDEGDPRYHGSSGNPPPKYGVVDRSRLVGRVDGEVHKITVSSFSRSPLIYDTDHNKARKVQRVSDWDWVRPGMAMCKTGIKTGKTCGKVTSRYYSPSKIPGSERFVRTDYCANSGDSGGGVYAPSKLASGEVKVTAYGIHSGGAADVPDCVPGQPFPSGDFSFYGHVQYAQTALGVRVQVTK